MRNRLFWIVDYLKGGKVRSHYNDIKSIMESFDSENSKNRREKHLKALLHHATNSCSFYKKYVGYTSLNDFPIINKSIIRDGIRDISSSKFNRDDLYEMSTSGSSGTPFTTLQNKNKKHRNTADTIYFKQRAGFEIGYRLYYIRKWFAMHTRSRWTTYMRNIEMVNVTDFDDEYLSSFIKKIENDGQKQVIISYASALKEICNFLDDKKSGGVKNNLQCIIAVGEHLTEETRKSLKKYFNAPVLVRYSNLENGILSLQLSEKTNNLQINSASYYVEIVHPEKDEPVKEGEIGRIVVTDLFNYAMPFIRYDTGDLGSIISTDDYFPRAPAFKKVEGRRMDAIYDTKGNIQSSYIIFHLESYPKIKQFQFIQEAPRDYTLVLNVENNFASEIDIVSLFKSYLGEDANINIKYVEGIPQLSSGKRRLTINNHIG